MSSEHDKAVLNCIFNPLLPVGELVYDELPHALQGLLSEFGLVGMHRHRYNADRITYHFYKTRKSIAKSKIIFSLIISVFFLRRFNIMWVVRPQSLSMPAFPWFLFLLLPLLTCYAHVDGL
jgi:hypothetical protein